MQKTKGGVVKWPKTNTHRYQKQTANGKVAMKKSARVGYDVNDEIDDVRITMDRVGYASKTRGGEREREGYKYESQRSMKERREREMRKRIYGPSGSCP